jgi:hypothetical protein
MQSCGDNPFSSPKIAVCNIASIPIYISCSAKKKTKCEAVGLTAIEKQTTGHSFHKFDERATKTEKKHCTRSKQHQQKQINNTSAVPTREQLCQTP